MAVARCWSTPSSRTSLQVDEEPYRHLDEAHQVCTSQSSPSAAECREIRDSYLYDSALPNAAIGPQLRGQGCGDAAYSLLVGPAN